MPIVLMPALQYRVALTLTAAALFFSVIASVIHAGGVHRRDELEGESDHGPN
jgi:hypothetical protein